MEEKKQSKCKSIFELEKNARNSTVVNLEMESVGGCLIFESRDCTFFKTKTQNNNYL